MSDRGASLETPHGEDAPDDRLPPAPPSRGKDQGLWVGLFLVLGLVAILGALFILTDAALFRGRYIIKTYVTDAGGIRRGDPVQMRGVNIGRVLRFKISQQGVEIQLEIEGEYQIPKDSYVELVSAGPLGGVIANVVPGHSTEMVKGGDVLSGKNEETLNAVLSRVGEQLQESLERVQKLLSPELIQNVHGSSADLRQTMTQLSATVNEERSQISALTTSLRRSASGLEKATTGPELERTVKRLDTLGQRMDEVGSSLTRSAKSVEDMVSRVEHGEGTLGKLAKDETIYNNLHQASTTMNDTLKNLNQATTDLRTLMDDIKKNPRKYFKFSVF